MQTQVKFFSYEWDNYQGGSGKVIKHYKSFEVSPDCKISDVKNSIFIQNKKL